MRGQIQSCSLYIDILSLLPLGGLGALPYIYRDGLDMIKNHLETERVK